MRNIVEWDKLTLANNFMFCRVMETEPELCRQLVEILLGFEVKRIEIVKSEYALQVGLLDKGIRMDVYCKVDDRVIDLEMQTINRKDLAKRTRYYQSIIDMDLLNRGEPYANLKESYVVFLCLEDPIGEGLPVYFFENTCRENAAIKLKDGSYKVFFNAEKCATLQDERLTAFFEFLQGQKSTDRFTDKLSSSVERLKTDAIFRGQYMTWEQSIHEEAEILAEKLAEERVQERVKKITEERVQELAEKLTEERVQELAEKLTEERVQEIAEKRAEEKQLETARNLLSLNLLSIEQIAKAQGLPVEKVREIARDLEKA
ncbi:MAG: Rpn family recombination-promoting nuclease/putative transposase [Treponema sp.]|nr:Rpn family recombination-promoting nuclease/putative transposase [Treponema sp.]